MKRPIRKSLTIATKRSQTQAMAIIVDTLTTAMGNPNANLPEILLEKSNKMPTPFYAKDFINKQTLLTQLGYPLFHWRDIKEGNLRASTLGELVNYFLDHHTPIDIAYRKELLKAKTISTEEVNRVLYKYEYELKINDVEVARKLPGDESVYEWMMNANYDPNWAIQLFNLFIEDTHYTSNAGTNDILLIQGLESRIYHFNLLMSGKTQEAEELRHQQNKKADAVHSAFTLSTVI